MSNLVLDAEVLLPLGPPYCGKHVLAQHLIDVGIVEASFDEFDVLEDPNGCLSASDEAAIFDGILATVPPPASGPRTLAIYSFLTIHGIDRVLDLALQWEDRVCLIIMESGLEAALERHARQPRYAVDVAQLTDLYEAFDSVALPSIRCPFEMASTLAIATEGQDDW